jgi:hypothetical protein
MTERPNEKNEYAVTEKTDGRHGEDNAHGRQFRAGGEREASIYSASSQTLPHGDLRRITCGIAVCVSPAPAAKPWSEN